MRSKTGIYRSRIFNNNTKRGPNGPSKMSLQTPIWLSVGFVEKVLKNSERDDSIEVKAIATKCATENGDNYMSDMIRVGVEYSRNKFGYDTAETKSLIVKIAPTRDNPNYKLVTETGVFEKEIKMMEDTLVKMNNLLNEKDYRLNARVLYAEIGDSSFLVIDDLVPMGYRMADRKTGLDMQHCILAIRGLAKFHASSVALCEKEPNQKLSYTKGVYHKERPDMVKKFFTDGMRMLATELANWPELGSTANVYSEKLLKLSTVCYERASECVKPKDDEFNVISHGDCWVNNMLFRYEDGIATNHIFVDFQVCSWSSPAIDILHFLNTSASDDVYVDHRAALIEEYLNILTKTMTRLGCKMKPPSMADLQKSLEDHAFLAVLSSTLGLAFALIDKCETKKLGDMIQVRSGYVHPAYRTQTYRMMMLKRLNDWNSRGLIDV